MVAASNGKKRNDVPDEETDAQVASNIASIMARLAESQKEPKEPKRRKISQERRNSSKMANDVIGYRSDYHLVNGGTNVLETKSHYKIKCIWSGRIYGNQYNFTWKFNWNKLRNQGVDKLTGHIYVSNTYTVLKIEVELTENNQVITKEFDSNHTDGDVYYTYYLTPHYTPVSEKPPNDEMFAPSDQNDTILIVEGKKLHVNKTFLSYHSEYFRALFSTNFKEGQMDEIPIGDVSFEDFALLLSTFHPNPVFVTDATVEKILEMARRFLVSSVIKVTEHHLLNMSKINNEKMLLLADEYGMPTLLEKSIRGLDTLAKAKQMKKSQNVWSGGVYGYPSNRFSFEWQFDWNQLKNEGVDKLTGHITLISLLNSFTAKTIDVELTENNQVFTEEFECKYLNDEVSYQYFLIPHYISAKPSDDEMFAPSDQNDTILVVDGKKLYVSKSFLSSHSEYFRALFSSNFKEGQMDEIPIGDVSYEDFAFLLKNFYPNPVLPTDKTVEKLLELARRFLVSSVINVAEHHLLNMSKIDNKKMLVLADEYGMPTLLEKCICKMDKLAKVKKMKNSEKYEQLSDKTKLKVFDRVMDFI